MLGEHSEHRRFDRAIPISDATVEPMSWDRSSVDESAAQGGPT